MVTPSGDGRISILSIIFHNLKEKPKKKKTTKFWITVAVPMFQKSHAVRSS